MILSRYNLKKINLPGLIMPGEAVFELPERILQFGTGVLLRGLPDCFIDKANREGVFNGRIVVVKSTENGSASDFDKQDSLYTLHIKGIQNEQETDQQIICSAISRVLSATNDWASILKVAHNPNLKIIISNTTEAGIVLVQDDVKKHPPLSFPGKLLAILYERYKAFDGSDKSGLVIIPTELIVDNGKKLESIVLELAHLNKLDPAFMDWLENSNFFCNSLVDRIVPGKPSPYLNTKLDEQMGYRDELRIVAEPYCLWAIEGNDEIKAVLSFEKASHEVIVMPDIETFRELKLRLLNGTHSLGCAVAILSGFKTVSEAMSNPSFSQFITNLMIDEIVPVIPYAIDEQDAIRFTLKVSDRFKNPTIQHQWMSIAAYYSAKLKLRVVPLLLNHYKLNNSVPERFAFGFAAFIRFMKVIKQADGKFVGQLGDYVYTVSDSHADKFQKAWESNDIKVVVDTILKDTTLWDTDITKLQGFKTAVERNLNAIMHDGALKVLAGFELKNAVK